ncbi:NUDIX domain-containing protein, partial [Serratia marcescens]|uniref:NUDIX domain-containing protein n=1 Tax=Serratia marcescens TaxID=615 RepID=UPI0013DAA188
APARPMVGASIAVIRDGRVLLAQRANEPMRGVWTLPGGVVEAGERLAEAALRELMEEVGLTAEVVACLSPT